MESLKLRGLRKHNGPGHHRETSVRAVRQPRFTHSGHIIRFMLQCKLAPRSSGYIIPAPSLKSTEDGDGNWRIYVSWHGFLAHCPPSLHHPDSSVVYAAVFNPINLKLTAFIQSISWALVRLIFLLSLRSQSSFNLSSCPRPPIVCPLWLCSIGTAFQQCTCWRAAVLALSFWTHVLVRSTLTTN